MNISAVHPSAKAGPVERAEGKVLRGEGRVAAVAKSAHVSESAVRCGLERVKQRGLATPMRKGKPLGLPEERVLLWLERRAEEGDCAVQPKVWVYAEKFCAERELVWKATKGWWQKFLKRYHDRVSLRKPQEMDTLQAEDPRQLQHWFSLWEAAVQKCPRRCLVCVDETGRFIGYDSLHGKVVALKGAKVAMRQECQQREWVSIVGGGNAEGKLLPPTFLIRGNVGNMLSDQQKAAKWLAVTTEEAWILSVAGEHS